MSVVSTDMLEMAVRFVNSTSTHIFLTGKAGTGKTTFLKNLAERTHKQFVVVAPTGIAALNAGGVTIHSQFLLPLGLFLPGKDGSGYLRDGDNCYTQDMLAKKHPLNSARKQVLRSIDLLVIDEVSMLRADLLDAIDYRLRSARGNFRQSFGGVQLLMIGDLYQLPPVVKRTDAELLNKFYDTPWFYESKALKQDNFTYIELDRIFRQSDTSFINILNNLRCNTPSVEDVDILNRQFKSAEEIENLKEVITLTTHNYKADELNARELRNLSTKSHFFDAHIEGDFPESMYPVLSRIELKEGAQVMFVRNDNEDQLYFNGKLATVTSIEDDEVIVKLSDQGTTFTLKTEKWENKKYSVNPNTKDLEEEVIGSFKQFPIKLAWAITVHKSQGLTFDRAIIDLEQAFADGQVYVALSRLRSLEGLVLRNKIRREVISTDQSVVSFSQANHLPDQLPQVIKDQQTKFIAELIDSTFDFEPLLKEIGNINRSKNEVASLAEASMQPVLEQITKALIQEKENTVKFRRQLAGLLSTNDSEVLIERVEKGGDYYRQLLWENEKSLLQHIGEMRQHKRVKVYLNSLDELDQLMMKKIYQIDKTRGIIQSITHNREVFNFNEELIKIKAEREALLLSLANKYPPTLKKGKRGGSKSKSGKRKDGLSTYDVTLQMLHAGMTPQSIAKERGLVVGTIEGHLAKAVEAGKIKISDFMTEQEVNEISTAIDDLQEGFESKALFNKLGGKYSYGRLRAVINHRKLLS